MSSPLEATPTTRFSRRVCLRLGALAPLGLGLADIIALRRAEGATLPKPRAQSVILIYAGGGISHHDTFDPKPDAPAEVRGEFKPIATRVAGIAFTDQTPRLAQIADQLAVVRSVHHRETDHGVGAYFMLRGYRQPDPTFDRPENQLRAHPTLGAHVARLRGSPNGLPPYVCVPGLSYLAQVKYYTAGWMGREYDPCLLKADPSHADFKTPGLALEPQTSESRLRRRRTLLHTLGAGELAASPAVDDLRAHYEQAFSLLTEGSARRAFEISGESEATREAYGRNRWGQSCLLARRLVEAGVPFVTVDDFDWDHHAQIFPSLRTHLPKLDRALATLVSDLADRGLLSTTLVVLLTDFGRTPRVNKSAGRDHWPGVFSILFAGAGIVGGQTIGASDPLGASPSRLPISPKDVAATLYCLLGIDPFQAYRDRAGRPFQVLDEGRLIGPLAGGKPS